MNDEEVIRAVAVQVSRAVALSCLAATASERMTDDAIAAADEAWLKVADAFTPPDPFSRKA